MRPHTLLPLPATLPLLGLLWTTVAGAATPRLDHAAAPTRQAITLRLDPDQQSYSGAVHIELRVTSERPELRLHGAMPIDRLRLRGPAGEVPATHQQVGQELRVRGPAKLAPGTYSLDIDFHQPFGQKAVGLYRVVKDGQGYAFTQFEAADARLAFPCWDEPDFKIPYQLTVEIPKNLEAVSNTPIASQREDGAKKTLVFQETRPLPSYLLALAVGPLEFAPIPGLSIPGRVVTPRGQRHLATRAVENTPAILRALESYFGGRYPYEKLDLIAVPEYWPGAMENPGAITFRENILLYDPKAETPGQRQTLVAITAHELAHMWFGDLVTMRWWDDLWLNESFADWMGEKIAAQLLPQHQIPVEVAQDAQRIMISDARPATQAIRQRVDEPEDSMRRVMVAYQKGNAVLTMFERWLGEDRFRAGVRAHLAAHADGNAESADLWAALRLAAKGDGDVDVPAAMATFIDQPGLPLVSVEILPHGQVRLAQRRFHNAGVTVKDQRWRVPVSLKFSDGKTVTTRTVLLTEAQQVVPLTNGELAWVFPLAEAAGYYRFHLPGAQLQRLSRDARDALTPAERVALLGNLGALLNAGELGADQLLRTLAFFGDDPHPRVLAAALEVLDRVRGALVTDELRAPFAAYLRRLLGPARQRLGLAPRPGEDPMVTLLRPALIGVLGQHGQDPEILAQARVEAQAFLADPARVAPSLAGTWLALAAQRGDRALFEGYRRGLEATRDTSQREQLLEGLAHFGDAALRDEALRYALGGSLRMQELLVVPFVQAHALDQRAPVFAWMTERYPQIAQRLPEAFLPQLAHVAGGCDEALAERARQFFSQPGRAVPGMSESLAKLRQQVSDCATLRRRESAAASRYLRAGG